MQGEPPAPLVPVPYSPEKSYIARIDYILFRFKYFLVLLLRYSCWIPESNNIASEKHSRRNPSPLWGGDCVTQISDAELHQEQTAASDHILAAEFRRDYRDRSASHSLH